MKPVTYDFDVITDAPRVAQSPKRRPPEPAEPASQADAERERSSGQRFAPPEDRRHASPPERDEHATVRAAE
jgi:hypothetical protein